MGPLRRNEAELLDGLAALAQPLDGGRSSAALADTGLIAMQTEETDLTDGALGSSHGEEGEGPPAAARPEWSRQGR